MSRPRRSTVLAVAAVAVLAGALVLYRALPLSAPYQLYTVLPVATAVVVPGLLVAAARASGLGRGPTRVVCAVQVVMVVACLASVAFLWLGGDPNIGGGMAVLATFTLLAFTTAVCALVVIQNRGD